MTPHTLLMGFAALVGAALLTSITVLLDLVVRAAGKRRGRL